MCDISILLVFYISATQLILLFNFSSCASQKFIDANWAISKVNEKQKETIQKINETQRFLPEDEVCGTLFLLYKHVDSEYNSTIQLAQNEKLFNVVGNLNKKVWIGMPGTLMGYTRNNTCVFLNCGLPFIDDNGGCVPINFTNGIVSENPSYKKSSIIISSVKCTCVDPHCEKSNCSTVHLESDECARIYTEAFCQECYNESVKMHRAMNENGTHTSPSVSINWSRGNQIKSVVVNVGSEIWIEERSGLYLKQVLKLQPGGTNALNKLDPRKGYQFRCLNTNTSLSTYKINEVVENNESRYYDIIIIVSATVAAVILLASGIVLVWRKSANVEKEMRENSISKLDLDEFFNGKQIDKNANSPVMAAEGPANSQYKTFRELKQRKSGEKSATAAENQQAIDIALSHPYQWKWEIPKRFIKKSSTLLGKGEFGEVSSGLLIQDKTGLPGGEPMPVAVKEAKRELLRPLLMEIKILSYIGQHSNVVSMLGASVSDLRKGKSNSAWLVLERCQNGSLKSMVDGHRQRLKDFLSSQAPEGKLEKCLSQELMSNKILCKWAFEIALGMEFLEQKKILHIDLAARNVLLDGDLVAKIGDFGSARKLYSNPEYWKRVNLDGSTNEPLAYKWMALESLQLLVFSPKSEVWSYGVTLWEMFEYGKEPYGQIHQYDQLFTSLKSGMRLPQPTTADDHIFSNIRRCWEEDPNVRPSFTELQQLFKAILKSYCDDNTFGIGI